MAIIQIQKTDTLEDLRQKFNEFSQDVIGDLDEIDYSPISSVTEIIKGLSLTTLSSSFIAYTGSSPGLSATTIQDAIDEIVDDISEVANDLANLEQNKISDGDSSVTVSDDSSPSNISFVIDGTEEGYFDANGLTVTNDISSNSDIRLKKDIIKIDNALNKVNAISGYTFTFKESGNRSTGLIAQELEQVLPEAVNGDDIKSIAYGNVVGLLVEAIKEQQNVINTLVNKIESIEQKLF